MLDFIQEAELLRAFIRRRYWEFYNQGVAAVNAYANAVNASKAPTRAPKAQVLQDLQTTRTPSGTPWIKVSTTNGDNAS